MIRDANGILPIHIGIDKVTRQGLSANFMAEFNHLLENHLSHLWDLLHDFEGEVEGGWAHGLVGDVVPDA